jgi:hypothetical protein
MDEDAALLKGQCQHCHGPFNFPAQGVGLSVECPHCGTATVLQQDLQPIIQKLDPSSPISEDRYATDTERATLSRSSKDLAIAVGCIVVLGTLGLLLFGSKQPGSHTASTQAQASGEYQGAVETESQQRQRYKSAVRQVMAKYEQIANTKDPKIIRDTLVNIDTSKCPQDFRQTHLAVIQAVSEFIAYCEAHVPKNALEGAIVGVINNASGRDVDGGFTRLRQGMEVREGAVRTAMDQLKAVSNSY